MCKDVQHVVATIARLKWSEPVPTPDMPTRLRQIHPDHIASYHLVLTISIPWVFHVQAAVQASVSLPQLLKSDWIFKISKAYHHCWTCKHGPKTVTSQDRLKSNFTPTRVNSILEYLPTHHKSWRTKFGQKTRQISLALSD